MGGDNGEIKRAPSTCYPVPQEIARRLRSSESLRGMANGQGPNGRSYCVRCLVWRPGNSEGGESHHCNTCQRCVTGFDHHCGVFGRCITSHNLPCFYTMISMLFCGVVTFGVTHAMVVPPSLS